MASKLQQFLDRYFQLDIQRISNSPEGRFDDGLPLDQETLGAVSTDKGEFDITLRRVADSGREVWIFSARTLSSVAGVSVESVPLAIERYLPEALIVPGFMDVARWRWIALIVPVPLSFVLARLACCVESKEFLPCATVSA